MAVIVSLLVDSAAPVSGGIIYKGNIAVAADFPTAGTPQAGWLYVVVAAVTDNDPTKTNTGQTFAAGDDIFWTGTDWNIQGQSDVVRNPTTSTDQTVAVFNGASGKAIQTTPVTINPLTGAMSVPSVTTDLLKAASASGMEILAQDGDLQILVDNDQVLLNTNVNVAGQLTMLGAAKVERLYEVASGAGITISIANGFSQRITLDAATPVITAPSLVSGGQSVVLYLILLQDPTGGRNPSFVGITWDAGAAPNINISPNAETRITLVGTEYGWVGFAGLQDPLVLDNSNVLTLPSNAQIVIGSSGTSYYSNGAIVQHNGNTPGTWFGRIVSRNSTSDVSSFLGNFDQKAGVFAHNNNLSAWADLHLNTLRAGGGAAVYLGSPAYVDRSGVASVIWDAENGASNLPTRISTTSSIDGTIGADTILFTVPVGKTFACLYAVIRLSAVSGLTIVPVVRVKVGSSTILPSTTLTGLDSTSKAFTINTSGAYSLVGGTSTVVLEVSTPATATTLTLQVDLFGYFV
jgi:hypothetical protein